MTTHSSYWLDDSILDDTITDSEEGADLHKIIRLAAIRRAITNFVTILTNKNIPVMYSSGKQSYATGKEVVLSADDRPDKFDSMVGLALHEAGHILLTDFDFLEEIVGIQSGRTFWNGKPIPDPPRDIYEMVLHPQLSAMLPRPVDPSVTAYNYSPEFTVIMQWMFGKLKYLMNILEDRRIDLYVYQTASGYRPYYAALYNEDTLTKELGKHLKWNPKWREITVDNYMNRILLSIHPMADPDALPGLRQLYTIMDIQNIHRLAPTDTWKTGTSYDDMPPLWKTANEMLLVILKYVKEWRETTATQSAPTTGAAGGTEGVYVPLFDEQTGLPNLDMAPLDSVPMDETPTPRDVDAPDITKAGKVKEAKLNDKKADRDVEKLKQQLNGDQKKKKVNKKENDAIDALDQAQAELVNLKGEDIAGGTAMVINKMTEGLLTQSWFPFSAGWRSESYLKYIKQGRRMGTILLNRLQVRNDPVMTKTTRLPQGGMDRRLLAQLGMDITSVFQKSRVDTYKPAMLHLTLDASGSMQGPKWHQVLVVASALAYVGTQSRTIDTVITLRGGDGMPIVGKVFDSRIHSFNEWSRWATRLGPNGATPEGLCYQATMEMLLECSQTHNVYFINFSDGEPNFYLDTRAMSGPGKKGKRYGRGGTDIYYANNVAVNHTKKQIRLLKDNGIKVLSYFISSSSEYHNARALDTFRAMYGQDAVKVNVENATEVLRTLNKLLLEREG
jgi:hypothetical protein